MRSSHLLSVAVAVMTLLPAAGLARTFSAPHVLDTDGNRRIVVPGSSSSSTRMRAVPVRVPARVRRMLKTKHDTVKNSINNVR